MKLSNNPLLPQSTPTELVRLLREISRTVNDNADTATTALDGKQSLDATLTAISDGSLVIQPLDATLTALAALDAGAGLVEQTGADTFAKATVTTFAKTLLDDADAATARTTLGLGLTGTFTPVLTFATPGNVAVAYSNQLGRYSKFGRLVVADIYIVTSSFAHTTANGDLQVTGLPFTSENVSGMASIGSTYWQGITKASYTDIAAFVGPNAALCAFMASGSGQSLATVKAADVPTGGTVILRFSISYLAAS